jgi:hypothetical protein
MSRKPWIKFYPADWRSDPRLRMCSLVAVGLWIELVCYMHEGEPYGHLTVEGRPIGSAEDVAKLIGRPRSQVKAALKELEKFGVFSLENGVIVSRRMVRDFEKAKQDQEHGKKGGNPNLKRGVNPQVKAQKLDTRIGEVVANAPTSPIAPDDEARARATTGKITSEAFDLTGEILVACQLDRDHPMAIGAAYQVQSWLNEGCRPDLIMSAVRRVMAKKRDGPPSTLAYFARAVAEEHVRAANPSKLPNVVIHETEPRAPRPGGIVEAGLRRLAILAERNRRQAAEAGDGGAGAGEGNPALRLLPSG